jgi:hypothetical protein
VSASDERAQRMVSALATPASMVVAANAAAMRVSDFCITYSPFLNNRPLVNCMGSFGHREAQKFQERNCMKLRSIVTEYTQNCYKSQIERISTNSFGPFFQKIL